VNPPGREQQGVSAFIEGLVSPQQAQVIIGKAPFERGELTNERIILEQAKPVKCLSKEIDSSDFPDFPDYGKSLFEVGSVYLMRRSGSLKDTLL
jgi:hypothetical protein